MTVIRLFNVFSSIFDQPIVFGILLDDQILGSNNPPSQSYHNGFGVE